MSSKKVELLTNRDVKQTIKRLAYEIYENNINEKNIILAGIESSGSVIAYLLKKEIESISKLKVETISIVINKTNPTECHLLSNYKLEKKNIIIVDDVANSGRTLLYAIRPFLELVPKQIQVAVLIDRKHKLFPITADYVGLQLSTTLHDNIKVSILNHEIIGAYLE